MNNTFFKWTLRSVATLLVLAGIVLSLVLNPSLLYGNKTAMGRYIVYHDELLDQELNEHLDQAYDLVKKSVGYDSNLKFTLCMNDGSIYPSMMQLFLGQAFALGFMSDKVVICGTLHCDSNYVAVNGYKWNFTQLIAHETTHCLVYRSVGLWNSNPVASHPTWKWEGYPEYIARREFSESDLVKRIDRYKESLNSSKDTWAIPLADGTVAPKEYFRYRLLMQYCLDIKKITYENLLQDTISELTVRTEMMNWYTQQKK